MKFSFTFMFIHLHDICKYITLPLQLGRDTCHNCLTKYQTTWTNWPFTKHVLTLHTLIMNTIIINNIFTFNCLWQQGPMSCFSGITDADMLVNFALTYNFSLELLQQTIHFQLVYSWICSGRHAFKLPHGKHFCIQVQILFSLLLLARNSLHPQFHPSVVSGFSPAVYKRTRS